MKRVLSIFLIAVMLLLFGCNPQNNPTTVTKPSAPQNINIDDNALITWDAVDGAVGYLVSVNGSDHTVTTTSYQASKSQSFTFSVTTVCKNGDNYIYSDRSQEYTFVAKSAPVVASDVSVKISGGTDIKGGEGQTLQLAATVRGEDAYDDRVDWSVTQGNDVVSVNENGLVTVLKDVTEEVTVEIEARCKSFPDVYDTRTLNVGVKPVLTQSMLDALGNQKISFSGIIDISSYTVGMYSELSSKASTTVYTVMDGENWYAEYTNSAGTISGLYCSEHNGNAALVGLSYKNVELYEDITDDDGSVISWEDAGFYNNFAGLKVSDFELDEDTWYFKYVGSDSGLAARMIASANPYDFNVDEENGFSLYVSDGEVSGLYAKSSVDYTVVSGYDSFQELKVAIFADDELTVPSIVKYSYDAEIHAPLEQAIANMQNLTSYKMNMCVTMSSYGTVSQNFIEETITPDVSYFESYTVSGSTDIAENRTYDIENYYGYYKTDEDGTLYNTFYAGENGKPTANRAYDSAVMEVDYRPSFDFAAEIFRSYYVDEESGETTYYLADSMAGAARLFYNCVGNDYDMLGLFATTYSSDELTIIPSVTVDSNGYIVSAQFYFYITIIYGVIEISYSEFNTATLPETLSFEDYEVRNVPTSWDSTYFLMYTDAEQDNEVNFVDYLASADIAVDDIPFFGTVLNDTFGFAMTSNYLFERITRSAILFYYDVPLDDDYTITSSLEAIYAYLKELGFTPNARGEYNKGNVWVSPQDNNLDLQIYIWFVEQ